MPSALSACVVLYHCGEEVFDALACLEKSNVEVSVFLCDNSPEERTAEELQWKFPGVVVLPQQGNIGFGRANNAALPFLKSKYHLIMNPDVTFDPLLLSRMIAYMDAHPNIAILTPRVLNEDGTEQFLPKKRAGIPGRDFPPLAGGIYHGRYGDPGADSGGIRDGMLHLHPYRRLSAAAGV